MKRAAADFVAARLLKTYEVDRAGVVLRGQAEGTGEPEDLYTAVSAAMGRLGPATARWGRGALSVTDDGGRCIGSLEANGSLAFDRCAGGEELRGAIRAALQMVEPEHGLLQRENTPAVYPVQAVAIGKQAVLLALGGTASVADLGEKRPMVVPFADDRPASAPTPAMREAIRRVLGRVR